MLCNSLVPIYPSATSWPALNKWRYPPNLLNITCGRCLVWIIKKNSYCSPCNFSNWPRGCVEVGWDWGIDYCRFTIVVFLINLSFLSQRMKMCCFIVWIYLYYTGYIACIYYKIVGRLFVKYVIGRMLAIIICRLAPMVILRIPCLFT